MLVFPENFAAFHGNKPVADSLRAAVAARRLPHALILSGPRGSGKYTLALMLIMALECELQPRERSLDGRALASFCGTCKNCVRIRESANLDERVSEAVAIREDMREVDKKETRIMVQTHPDVLILPPDPPQLLIKLGQVRALIARAQYLPTEAPAKVFLITSAAFMKEAANSLLKTLEEPPASAHIILLAENVSELLPTIRSRCAIFRLGSLPTDEIEAVLAERRTDLAPRERALLGRLSEGATGRALSHDLVAYVTARNDALLVLRNAAQAGDHSSLFRMTETYRAGAEGQLKTTNLIRALSVLLEDILLFQAGSGERVRNIDIAEDLRGLSESFSFGWIESAVRGLDGVQSGMRRNLLRNVSLDAFAAELEGAGKR